MHSRKQMPTLKVGSPTHMGRFDKNKAKLKDFKGTLNRLAGYLGDRKRQLVLMFVLCIITTIISIVGTRINGYVVDDFIKKGDINGLLVICGVMILVYLIGAVSTYIVNRIMVEIAQKTSAKIRIDLYKNVQRLPLNYFDSNSSGDLMSKLTNDVDNINTTLSQNISQLFMGVINIAGMFVAMLFLSIKLTAIGLLTMPLVFIFTRTIIKKTQPFFMHQQEELGNLNGYIEENISGQKAIILFGQEKAAIEKFNIINKKLTRSAIFAQALSGVMGPVNNFINNLTYLILAVSGAYFIINQMDMTIGIVFTFILYMRNFTRPINEISNIFNMVQSALAGAERVFEVIDEKKEEDQEMAKNVNYLQGEVIFKNVDFSYKKDQKILKDISFKAKAGQKIAIVGPTGSGKTTIINLLNKFYDIESGEIIIDGKNIKDMKMASLRNSISIILQDTYLFSLSVKENIRYGQLTATDKEIEEAAKLANAHKFIKQLPKGYDTILSDNGSDLSHGQRQLLAIARVVLAKSSILIMDEATSSVDTRTELAIQRAMLNLMEGKTTFIIAHRLSTIRKADEILVIKAGRIIEQGKHEELMENEGFYAGLYNSQFKK